MSDYYTALEKCRVRYSSLAVYNTSLYNFINIEFKEGIEDKLPLNKLNRWLGYIQGTLIAEGFTTVEAERNWTRPLFRPLDFP